MGSAKLARSGNDEKGFKSKNLCHSMSKYSNRIDICATLFIHSIPHRATKQGIQGVLLKWASYCKYYSLSSKSSLFIKYIDDLDGVIILNNFTVCSDLPKIGPGGKILIAEIYRQFGVLFKKIWTRCEKVTVRDLEDKCNRLFTCSN